MSRNTDLIKEQISIIDYAKQSGFTVVRKGRYYSLKEHDSIMLDPRKNCYWQNSVSGSGRSIGKGGSVIDFAVNVNNLDLAAAIAELEKQLINPNEFVPRKKEIIEKKVPGELKLPKPDTNMRKVFAYLIKTRCIAGTVVQEFVDRKMLYQDIHGNCVFVAYDFEKPEKAVFATMRGTNTYKPFYGDVSGCDYDKCFFVDNNSETICITESVIDAMSIMTMTLMDVEKMNYLVLAGVGKWKCINNYLQNGRFKKVVIAVDNDEKGREAKELIWNYMDENFSNIQKSKVLPPQKQGKDWNSVLQTMKRGKNL